jgi:hypothetical protein
MPPKLFAAPPSTKRPRQILQNAAINVVRVRLRAREKYTYSRMYDGHKDVISSTMVTSGGLSSLWDQMQPLHTFHADLLHEPDCIEIVVIRKSRPHIEQVWSAGRDRSTIPSYFNNSQWTDASNTVRIHTDDVIEIRLKPHDTTTPSPERAGASSRAASRHRTPPPQPHKLHPPNDPNLINPGPTLAHFVAMRACLQRIE